MIFGEHVSWQYRLGTNNILLMINEERGLMTGILENRVSGSSKSKMTDNRILDLL